MMLPRRSFYHTLNAFLLLFTCQSCVVSGAIPVTPPQTPPSNNVTVVYPNFLGISLELSFINYYFGNNSNEVPLPFINYLSSIKSPDRPVRLRLGGNSMDSSTYVPTQQEITQFTNPNANSNDQPVNYGPALFDVMNKVSDSVGGAEYLIGLSLREPNNSNIPLLAGDAQKALGDRLDAFLLGNEPDLYTRHGQRPYMANYSVNDYIGDYWVVFNNLGHTPQGDVLSADKIAGPTICCAWDLEPVLTSGWLDQFNNRLKYITLQHYPQDNCGPTHKFQLDYYLAHANAVSLAQWQQPGLQLLASTPADSRKPLLMDEFSSASCGGIPGISDTFGAALWTVDYSLQMASVGYSGAYLHTRERGVTYNLFDPPAGPAGSAGEWTTNPTFYAYLPIAEALHSPNGSRVVDLNVDGSMQNKGSSVAGYAVYDANTNDIHRVVLFNFANGTGQPVDFSLPSSIFPASSNSVPVHYLTAAHANENREISWNSLTYNGVGDGLAVNATFSSAWANQTLDCTQGCSVQVPGPGVAVVLVGGQLNTVGASTISPGKTSDALRGHHIVVWGLFLQAAVLLCLYL
ncbi:glycoside hydrolase family 79 protein [Panus rudis PR-1116 ss-1]|nr:glycoside hydrolase family 79 protein [Panus rudis PR-1116 ss-1]